MENKLAMGMRWGLVIWNQTKSRKTERDFLLIWWNVNKPCPLWTLSERCLRIKIKVTRGHPTSSNHSTVQLWQDITCSIYLLATHWFSALWGRRITCKREPKSLLNYILYDENTSLYKLERILLIKLLDHFAQVRPNMKDIR